MFGLFNKKKVVPTWAVFFTPEEYAHFESELKQYFDTRGYVYTLDDGILQVDSGGDLQGEFGLVNLAQSCYRYMMPAFGSVIQQHFDVTLQNQKSMSDFSKKIGNFTDVQDSIGTRLYGPDMIGQDATLVHREFSKDIYEVLVYDGPTSIIPLSQKMIQSWGKENDFLFALGRKNIQKKYSFSSKLVEVGGAKMHYFNSEHYFVPNVIFDIQKYPELIGTQCTLIALPTRSEALFFPINSDQDRVKESVIFEAAHQYYKNGPGSLTDKVLFYKDGEYYNYGFVRNGDELILLPPEQFLDKKAG